MSVTDLLPVANHLWQSTLFVAAVWFLTLVLRNTRAAVRHRLWLAASIKFLIPLSVLVNLGTHFPQRTVPAAAVPPAVSVVIGDVGEPFTISEPSAPNWLSATLFFLWMIGAAANFAWWSICWLQLRRAMRRATPLNVDISMPVMSCAQRLEPGVLGVWRPVLLLPEGIRERLSPAQFQTVIAHELCHVRRRDNLTAAIHLFVEALFWFHPLVWWIKARLIEEQERACDEEVLRLGNDPQIYAETILKLCEFYLAAPLICVAGMTGSDLKKRIEEIMRNRVPQQLSVSRQALLAIALIAVLAAPFMIGVVRAKGVSAQFAQPETLAAVTPPPQGSQAPLFPTAPRARGADLRALGTVVGATTISVRPRIEGQLMAVGFNEGDRVQGGQLLASIDPRPFQIQLVQAQSQLSADQSDLARARVRERTATSAGDDIPQLEAKVGADQAKVDSAVLQLSYSEIRSPITGVAGLRLVDPGNIVRLSDTTPIVVITQLQPIAVLFNIPEDSLPQALALLRSGSNVTVEAWGHDDSAKLATGRLVAVDNQIDTTTGTVKLKAVFGNKDNALFPNQFVNVRMLLN
jgi:RND family efflux transporter MFP subunit